MAENGGGNQEVSAQQRIQALSEEYRGLQDDLGNAVQARQKLSSQQQENLGVQREFKSLNSDSNIYKLIGPVLLKQDKMEATQAVEGRLEYIGGELKRVDKQITEIQEKSEGRKMEIYQLQSQAQQAQQAQTQAGAASVAA